MRLFKFTIHKLLVVLLLAGQMIPLLACCPAWRSGADFKVSIADQEILILWDSDKHIEHFIRRANFKTAENDFGFLVPTPTEPMLAEAPNGVFDRLNEVIKPKTVDKTRYSPDFTPIILAPFLIAMNFKGASSYEAHIRVLQKTNVGGYDAVVLEADDVDALLDWLKDHEYDARPALKDWLEPYIKSKWVITAFKYSPETRELTKATSAVRMSFSTDRPLFPYRVPKDQLAEPGRGSLLRVYFVGDKRMAGVFEDRDKPWPGMTNYADTSTDIETLLEGVLSQNELPKEGWLTVFEDHTWPGGIDDLFFEPAISQDRIIPRSIENVKKVSIPLPLDVALCIGLFLRYRRNKKEKS